MRILHTSDWHLGRMLEGRSRQEEQAKFVDEICLLAETEKIDLVLLAGDIFDSVNPSAVAEELFYDALNRLSAEGKRAVVAIAGNHDNPERLCAAAPLAVKSGITLCGLPKDELQPDPSGRQSARQQEKVVRTAAGPGWIELRMPGCPDPAVVAMLPYPSEARLNEVLSASLDEEILGQEYAKRVRQLFISLSGHFRPGAVNLGLSHLFVQGGLESESERPIQLGGAPAVGVEALDFGAQYVALGHLHRPQVVRGAGIPIRYAGSPLAYSFSEAAQAKSVTLVEAFPGRAAAVREMFLSAGYPLVKWRAKEGLDQVWRWLDEGKDRQAWIDLEVHLDGALRPEEIQNLRRERPRLLHIRPIFPESETVAAEARAKLPLPELFRKFYQSRTGGAEPEEELVSLFLRLLQAEGNKDGSLVNEGLSSVSLPSESSPNKGFVNERFPSESFSNKEFTETVGAFADLKTAAEEEDGIA